MHVSLRPVMPSSECNLFAIPRCLNPLGLPLINTYIIVDTSIREMLLFVFVETRCSKLEVIREDNLFFKRAILLSYRM